MSDVLPVTRITAQNVQAIKMELGPNGATAGVIAALLAELMDPRLKLGYTTENLTDPIYNGGWRIKIFRGDDAELVAYTGDWIVVTDAAYDDVNGWQLHKTSRVHIYGVSAGMSGTAVDFVNMFTANTPLIWDNLTFQPKAEALANLEARLTFKQPLSANGPFQYRLASGPGTAGTFSDPDEQTGDITVTITGLTEGAVCNWTIQTKATLYQGIQATSLVSNDITAVTTLPIEAVQTAAITPDIAPRFRGPGAPTAPADPVSYMVT